ncbi:oligosaccharide flippase family protein [Adhaeribacter pallidiroseus]|uniref:Polysaccharide biosynthesis protein C-terminal domain-containing protein n=1 Tax=Adhaeribacter pallidiroseus TaxID=2072847 RepID=A0A369QHB7_9BACT|nr:oligosaccharide flippase family protein [Adhaeribacter pallidiroseus]RDC62965.1 hypothetical protein AHMF7616_01564 [Adhaeribacter pallidiroseus]
MLNIHTFKDLKSSDFLKNVLKLSGGTIFSQLLSIFSAPIISRLYSPAQFGEFALFSSIISIILIFSTLRYDFAIVIAKTKLVANTLINICIILIALFFFISTVVSIIYKLNTGNSDALANFILWIPVTAVIVSSIQILLYALNRENSYSAIAFSKVLQNVLNSSISISNGIWIKSNLGLIYANIISGFLSLIYLFYTAKKSYKVTFRLVKNRVIKKVASHYKDFPLFSAPTSFLDTLSQQAPLFFITYFFSSQLAGHYSFAYRILSLPIILVGTNIGQVFYKKLNDSYLEKKDSRKVFLRTWLFLALLSIIPFTILFFFGGWIFNFVFSSKWELAGNIASVISPLLFLTFISSPTSTGFIVLKKQRVNLIFGLAVLVYRPIALYIGFVYKDFMLGLILFTIFEIIQIFIYNFIMYSYYGRKYSNWRKKTAVL